MYNCSSTQHPVPSTQYPIFTYITYLCIQSDAYMALVFFRSPKPKRFEYKPLYYDQERDELEERKRELGLISEGDSQARLRAEIRRKWKRGAAKPRSSSASYLRTLIYLFIVVISVYVIFFTDLLKNIFFIFGAE